MNLEKNYTLAKATFIIGSFTLISRVTGLLRDRVFASKFGAGEILDTYYAAFRVPDLIFNLLILGTLSVAFIPVFSEILTINKEKANKIASTVLNLSTIFIGVVCLVTFIFLPWLIEILVPGFSLEQKKEALLLSRFFLISPVIFTISNIFGSILNSQKKFLAASISPIFYNLGIIFGAITLYPRFGMKGLAFGVIIGAVSHMIIQFVAAVWNGYKWSFSFSYKQPEIKQIAKLFFPRIFGIESSQLSLLIGSFFGSFLAKGSITVLNLANNLQAVPLGLFAYSTAQAAFPALSEQYVNKTDSGFMAFFSKAVIQILYFIIPASILILILRAFLVRLAFGAGNFDWTDTILTFNTLGIFSLSLFSQSLLPLLARGFYARQNTKTPVLVGLASLIVNFILSYFLSKKFGVLGLAAGFSISNVFNLIALYSLFRNKIKETIADNTILKNLESTIANNVFKISFSATLSGLICYGLIYFLSKIVNTHTAVGILIQSGVSSGLAILAYLYFTNLQKLDCAVKILGMLKQIFKFRSKADVFN